MLEKFFKILKKFETIYFVSKKIVFHVNKLEIKLKMKTKEKIRFTLWFILFKK